MQPLTYKSGFRALRAWQEAHRLTIFVYQITNHFPREERYGVISQLRDAASSVGAQLAEGSRMPTKPHKKLYYDRAYASAAEVDNFLELAHDLKYLTDKEYSAALEMVNKVSYLIYRLSASLKPLRSIKSTSPTLLTVPTRPTVPSPVLH